MKTVKMIKLIVTLCVVCIGFMGCGDAESVRENAPAEADTGASEGAVACSGNTATGEAVGEAEGNKIDLSHVRNKRAVEYTVANDVTDLFSNYSAREDFYYMDPGICQDFHSIVSGLPNVKKFSVERGNTAISAKDGILYNEGKKELVACPLQKGGSIRVAEGTTCIGKESFFGNEKITSVHIPASVTKISKAAFGGNTSLRNITVSPDNENYTSKDGVLYTKNFERLMCYPAGKTEKSFVLPKGVVVVSAAAFLGAKLESVNLDNGELETIDCGAFSYMPKLKEAACGKELRYICAGAFQNCALLEKVDLKEGVVCMEDEAFSGDENVREMTIPSTVIYFETPFGNGAGVRRDKGKTLTVSRYSVAYRELKVKAGNGARVWGWKLKVRESARKSPDSVETKLDAGEGKADMSWYKSGRKKFYIKNADELAGLASLVNGGNAFCGKTVVLKEDIDLLKYGNWRPIGLGDKKRRIGFQGVFDGNGHTIYNLRSTSSCAGLFADISKGSVVKNVKLENAYVAGDSGIGSFADSCRGTIRNCEVRGLVEGVEDIGAIVGCVDGGKIEKCMSYAKVYACGTAGGIAGAVRSDGKIEDSESRGEEESVDIVTGITDHHGEYDCWDILR